jgi:hypothetical protein
MTQDASTAPPLIVPPLIVPPQLHHHLMRSHGIAERLDSLGG